jgi:hypothetical protein
VVQIANDPTFKEGVLTLFNNDYANKLHLGRGEDQEYHESFEGKLVSVNGTRARYIRLYSDGSSREPDNTYLTVEAYGIIEH